MPLRSVITYGPYTSVAISIIISTKTPLILMMAMSFSSFGIPTVATSLSSSSSGTASVTLYHAHYWVVVFHPITVATWSLDSVHLIMSVCYFVPPTSIPSHRHSRGIPSSSPIYSSPSESAADSSALFFAPSKYIPAYSHQRRDTLAPCLWADRS